MNPEQERQAQAQRVEDRIQELDKDLRFLSLQIAKIAKMIRTALEQGGRCIVGSIPTET